MTLGSIVAVLRSFSESEARRFYVDYLGFTVDFEHRFAPDAPLYCGLSKGDAVIHLSEHHGDGCPGAAIRIWVDDLDALLAELKTRPHPRLNPGIVEQSWGLREMLVPDPFGNKITFAETPTDDASQI